MRRINFLFIIFFVSLLISCQTKHPEINSLIEDGDYTKAEKLINQMIATEKISEKERDEMQFQIERMNRIRKDFSKTSDDILRPGALRSVGPFFGVSGLCRITDLE